MRLERSRYLAFAGLAVTALAAGAVLFVPHGANGQPAPQPQPSTAFSCNGFTSVTVTSNLPADINSAAGQQGTDCFAWQQFIALNWRAGTTPGKPDPGARADAFGKPPSDPRNPAKVVWQTFVDSQTIINGDKPQPFGETKLIMTSKVGDKNVLSSTGQAFTNGAWLTDQDHGLTYYEILVNYPEYTYITDNKLDTISGQKACASIAVPPSKSPVPTGFNLPSGYNDTLCNGTPKDYGTDGSIEIKSAWIVLDPQRDAARMKTYLTAKAMVQPPGGTAKEQIVGLVGLHIIRKTRSAQQFVWSTFEHVDNDPQRADLPVKKRYTYYNPACKPKKDFYKCAQNHMPRVAPPRDPYEPAMQIVREMKIPAMSMALNKAVWAILPSDSVFRNYEFIDAIWPSSNTRLPAGGRIPLAAGAPQFQMAPLTNTTLETYFQLPPAYSNAKLGCMDCHISASIATSSNITVVKGQKTITIADSRQAGKVTAPSAPFASDYSFIFDDVTRP